ncbi:MAG: ketoacyl-ACP synthase III [Clostridiales bacterium]|nr:ketoacyl-ACP synthase III [Clostridiales bacterium]
MSHVAIIGTGRYLPEHIMTNDDLSELVDTSDEWIRTRTGIRERRVSTGISTSDLAYEAGKRAVVEAGLKPEDIDLIICTTITPDYFMPSCACIVQERIGAVNSAAFDLTAACTGMIYGMVTAEQFIKSGMYENVLVIGSETLSRILDWEDRSSCVLFGDGAGAVVMSKTDKGGVLLASRLEADGSKSNLLTCSAIPLQNPYVKSPSHFQPTEIEMQGMPKKDLYRLPKIEMIGQEVFKYAVRTITDNINNILKKAGLSIDDIAYIIPHQANQRIIEQASKFCKVPLERFYMNLDRYGNTSAASIGIALDELVATGELKQGDRLILVGFGGGMTSGSILLEWR